MYKEALQVSAGTKMEGKTSAADQWSKLNRIVVHNAPEQPIGAAAEHHPKAKEGQSSIADIPSTRNRQPTVKKYLDRITVAGLHNYLYATERYEKFTWHLTFLIGIVGTMFYLATTIQTYLEFTIVLDIQHETGSSIRLPNVWVCMPVTNGTFIRESFEKARPKLMVNRRVRHIAERWRLYNKPPGPWYRQWNWMISTWETVHSEWNATTMSWEYSLVDVIDRFILWTIDFSTKSPLGEELTLITHTAFRLEEMLYRAIDSAGATWPGYKTFYEEGMFSCESVMKNCTLNGITVDCCASGSMGHSQAGSRCFRFDVNQTALGRNLQQNGSSITLSFETIIDSLLFGDSVAYSAGADQSEAAEQTLANGISVGFGPRMPGLFEDWQQLGPATVSMITVKAIKKIEQTGCVQAYRFDTRLHIHSHPLIIKYFKEMTDPKQYTVATCEMGKLLDTIYMQCGCVLYYDTIRPQNDSDICTPRHMNSCLYKAFHDVAPEDKPKVVNSSAVVSSSVNPEDELKRATMRQLKIASSLECLPLCESWTYDFRASSMITEGPEGNVSRYFRNKVTVIFDPEYRVEMEVYKMDYTALIASLGDGFGLILGFSAVTVIQLPIWMIAAIVLRRKLKKVSPLGRQGAIHGHRQHSHKDTAV